MQTIEPFGSYEDDWQPTLPTVTLKEGIDLLELQSGVGTEFEVDPSAPLPGGSREEEAREEEFDQEEILQHLNFDCLDLGGREGTEEVESPFQRLAASMEDISGDGGVLKKLLHVGIGDGVPERALVRVHYNGYLEYADEPYDSSRLRGKQQQFVLGNDEVIPGWEIAVKSMRRNERSQFLISPEYAFGEMGCPPRIPPNATVLFEIELLGIVDRSGAEDLQTSHDQPQQISFKQRLATANFERETGNEFFQQNMIGKAIGKYLKVLNIVQ
jgi:FK506-binding protein 6